MTENNEATSAGAAAGAAAPASDASTAAELHALEGKVDAIGAELTRHEQAETAGASAPALGDIVIVREAGKHDAPGIIAEVAEGTITCNVFRGDHMPHVATHLTQIDPASESAGWFRRPRV